MNEGVNGARTGDDSPGQAWAEGDERSTSFRRVDPPAPEVGAASVGAGAPATTPPPRIPCTICPADMVDQGDPAGWVVYHLAEPLRWQVDGIEQPWATITMRAGGHLVCPVCSALVAAGNVAALVGRLGRGEAPRRASESAALVSAVLARLSAPVPAVDWRSAWCPIGQ